MPRSKKESRRNDPKTAAARAARSLNEQNSSNEEEDSETDQRLGDAIDHSEPSESRAIDIPPSDEDTSHSAGPSSQSNLDSNSDTEHEDFPPPIPADGDIGHQDDPAVLPQFDVPPPLDADEETLANDIYANVTLNDLRISLAFIFGLANASLDDPESGLDAAAVERIWNPPQHQLSLDNEPDLNQTGIPSYTTVEPTLTLKSTFSTVVNNASHSESQPARAP
ncbi:hypothetical protein P692DRAFT_20949551 [Suillus brevipes Sb2]|nr:hypothetical protein P692DRAFT_20949551 [Suillus brevipes Sb2]